MQVIKDCKWGEMFQEPFFQHGLLLLKHSPCKWHHRQLPRSLETLDLHVQ